MDKKAINNRLWELINEHSDGKYTVFANKTRIPTGTFQKYADGQVPQAKHLIRIHEALGVNINWLLTGKEPKYGVDIIIEPRPSVMTPSEMAKSRVESEFGDYWAVPQVEDKIAAGSGRIVEENIQGYMFVRRQDVGKRKRLVAVQLGPGEKSMQPTLQPGNIVIIDRDDKKLVKKGIYAARLEDDHCAIKRIHVLDDTILLLSDNPGFPPMLAHTTDLDKLIVGRVIWSCQNLLKKDF